MASFWVFPIVVDGAWRLRSRDYTKTVGDHRHKPQIGCRLFGYSEPYASGRGGRDSPG